MSYSQFLLSYEVSEVQFDTIMISEYIRNYNNSNLEGKTNWIHIRIHDSGEVDIVTHSIISDTIFNHIIIEQNDSEESIRIHSDIQFLIDEKCVLEFIKKPPIFFTITGKIPLALIRNEDLRQFLQIETGDYVRVTIEGMNIYLKWISEYNLEETPVYWIDMEDPDEFDDITRISRYFQLNVSDS